MRVLLRGYRFRYYYDEDLLRRGGVFGSEARLVRDVTVSLLEEIRGRLGVGYELYPFRGSMELLIYKQHFARRSRLLNRVHDLTVSRALKSRSGYVYLHNLVALVRDGEVVWYHKGWRRDLERWMAEAERIGARYGLVSPPLHLGFLALVLREPGYLEGIIRVVEEALKASRLHATSHDMLVLRVAGMILDAKPQCCGVHRDAPRGEADTESPA